MLTVRDLMTREVATVDPQLTLREAVRWFFSVRSSCA